MRSEVKKVMEADLQGHCLIMSVAVNKSMLWPRKKDGKSSTTADRDQG